MTRIVSLDEAKAALSDKFGGEVLICLQPVVDAAALQEMAESDDEKVRARLSGLWCTDLFAESAPRPVMRPDRKFFDVRISKDQGWWQPFVNEEPGKPDAEFVGHVTALLSLTPEGLFVSTTKAKRAVAAGPDSEPLLELNRSSTSRGANFPGERVGSGYANTARIRGLIEDRTALVPAEAIAEEPASWTPIRQFALESKDKLGKATLLTALAALNLIG